MEEREGGFKNPPSCPVSSDKNSSEEANGINYRLKEKTEDSTIPVEGSFLYKDYEEIHHRCISYALTVLQDASGITCKAFFVVIGIIREYSMYYKNMGYMVSFSTEEFMVHCQTLTMVAFEIARKHIDDYYQGTNFESVCKSTTEANYKKYELFVLHTVLDYTMPDGLSIVCWASRIFELCLSSEKFEQSQKETYLSKVIPQFELATLELAHYRYSTLEEPCFVGYMLVKERVKYDLRKRTRSSYRQGDICISDYIKCKHPGMGVAQRVLDLLVSHFGNMPRDKRSSIIQMEVRRAFQTRLMFDMPFQETEVEKIHSSPSSPLPVKMEEDG